MQEESTAGVYRCALRYSRNIRTVMRRYPEAFVLTLRLRLAAELIELNLREGLRLPGGISSASLGSAIRSGYECLAGTMLLRDGGTISPEEHAVLAGEGRRIILLLRMLKQVSRH